MILKKKIFSFTFFVVGKNGGLRVPMKSKDDEIVFLVTKDKKEVLIAGNKKGLLYIAKFLIMIALNPDKHFTWTTLRNCPGYPKFNQLSKGSLDIKIKNIKDIPKKQLKSYFDYFKNSMVPGDGEYWRPGMKKPRKLPK